MWTEADRRFLRSMRIDGGEGPPPLTRFVVEPGTTDGEFHVVDRRKRFADHVFGTGWTDPRAAAEDFARQMNDTHPE